MRANAIIVIGGNGAKLELIAASLVPGRREKHIFDESLTTIDQCRNRAIEELEKEELGNGGA